MISKNKSKFIISLQKKKVRDEEKLFVIEGDKLVNEFIAAKIQIKILLARPEFLNKLGDVSNINADEISEVTSDELKKVSTLKTPNNALAVVPMRSHEINLSEISNKLCVALDCIQDPGNLGTIIRAAAWFGIKNIVCSEDSADLYNPKVIQASMGAILHVNVYYTDLKKFFGSLRQKEVPVFGTVLEGKSVYEHKLSNLGIILFGNESKGISDELLPFITDRLHIPGSGNPKPGIESLNVGMAASVVFSEFWRKSAHIAGK